MQFIEKQPESQSVERSSLVRILAIASLALIFIMAICIGTIVHPRSMLDATVQFEGNQFRIYNNNDFQWTDVRLVLNSDYKMTVPIMQPHSEVVIMATQLIKDDGTAFNPATAYPSDFYIVARVSGSQMGSWFYKFR